MSFMLIVIRIALATTANDVTRTSADHYRVGAFDVATISCTTSASDSDGERARLVQSSTGKPFIAFYSDDGEHDGDCQIAGVSVLQLRK
jgi:hypothetical protein